MKRYIPVYILDGGCQSSVEKESNCPSPARGRTLDAGSGLSQEVDIDIRHDQDGNRFVAKTGHGEAVLQYARASENTLDYQSTHVPDQDREEGIGEELVLHALDWAEENGFVVIPSCPFVKHVLEEHPERVSGRG